MATQQLCQELEAQIKASGEIVRMRSDAPTAVILGDSYSSGDLLEKRTDGWAYVLGEAEGWDIRVAGVGYTGYVNPGPCGSHVFASRISRATMDEPAMLIVQGGLNDWQAKPQDVEAAAGRLLKSVKDLPTVVVVGPPNAPARAEPMPEIDAALARAASAAGRQYISTIGWDLEFLPDGLHLTKAGHAKFASLVAAALPRQQPAPANG